MATRGRKRRQKRRAGRREQRDLRKRGPKDAQYGGSQEALDKARGSAADDTRTAERKYSLADNESRDELDRARGLEEDSERDYRGYEQASRGSRDSYASSIDSIGTSANYARGERNSALGDAQSTRNQAYSQNQLTGTADNVLARRSAELAGAPTIGQAVETNIGANAANAQARLGQSMGLANRQARGLAGSMGEGGALAMQQAMASAGANSADLLAQNNTQQGQMAADLRLQAALRQNDLDVDSANLGLTTRMGAAEQERANQMAVAGANAGDILNVGNANAGNIYDAALQQTSARAGLMQQDAANQQNIGNRQLNLLGTRMDMAGNRQALAQQDVAGARQGEQFIEGAQLGVDQANNAQAYQAALANSPLNKLRNVLGGIRTVKSIASEGSAISGLTGIGKSA